MSIQRALETYRSIQKIMAEIEELLPAQDTEQLIERYQALEQQQTLAREGDRELLGLLRQGSEETASPLVRDLLELMTEIQESNQRLTPQIRGYMAVHQHELSKLQTGTKVMRHYHSHTDRSGQLISSTG
ncbi:hypothetical protein [Desulfogranum mediterraneum]|uniref:hypothetical protein n=1 Tax=Desulfogranum mediterraneum TaxID=160661 RepID=UPI000418D612|nr:hypothetical protein [Desulfogranum mediterraneum]